MLVYVDEHRQTEHALDCVEVNVEAWVVVALVLEVRV